jgi:hypothetical protein
MSFTKPGTYWIDDVRVNEGVEPDTTSRKLAVGVRAEVPVAGNVYVHGEPVVANVLVDSAGPVALVGGVINAWGEPVGPPVKIEASTDKPAAIDLPRDRMGAKRRRRNRRFPRWNGSTWCCRSCRLRPPRPTGSSAVTVGTAE